ncbi:DUF2793 domain-containing protein [Aurantiacibacter poecillastricola]|uniref:DUF2793 domain-containing protein n=1 Tax=Aurantiacibacter poecillastricola TaxID=3064385 RepID=UPI00273E9E3E|nr:DUF2793 domain-containing protein [Aurantiacibacter sp. 219JJ12-13]MDP5260320.1 DUF2793 domain-containing protein [Aurantiacibacter sp. 219JJ12-13]
MSDPYSFTATTPRLGLPNLFAAQAQKEFTVNEAFALLDALVHAVVEGMADNPPPSPVDGECWIVGSQPGGEWAEQAGRIACRQVDNWLFAQPYDGLVVYDRSAGQIARFENGWIRASRVLEPTGGATQDSEARAAITGVLAALRDARILPAD